MVDRTGLTRRMFLARTAAFGLWACCRSADQVFGAGRASLGVYLFDKVCAQAGLSLEETVELVESVGLEGVDCAVRVKDRIEPAQVRQDLPRYDRMLRARGRRVGLLTTAILDPSTPDARPVLEVARELGVRMYRVGFLRFRPETPVADQIRQAREGLARLVEWNRQLGLCALVQNHSPAGNTRYLGGDLSEMAALVDGFSPDEVAVAFDPAHALLVHGDGWAEHLDRLKGHLGAVYVKDVDRRRRFVPFGEGELGRMGFFERLRRMGYEGPVSLHIEYDWGREGRRGRAELELAVRSALDHFRRWWAAAAVG